MGPSLTTWLKYLWRWFSRGKVSELSLASPHPAAERIVVARDNLNALLHERHGEKVFLVHEERGILQLFKHCGTEEELRYRVLALAGLVGALDESLLRELSGSVKDGSLNLLEDFLNQVAPGEDHTGEVQVLRDLVRIRNMFPAHRDNARDALVALGRLGLEYPITDYDEAWLSLLEQYALALEKVLVIVKRAIAKP